MKFVAGIKILSSISLVLGIIVLAVCGWTFHTFWKREVNPQLQNSTLNGNPGNTRVRPLILKTKEFDSDPKERKEEFYQDDENLEALQEILNDIKALKSRWSGFKRFLLGSNGLALLVGVIQVITNLFILCGSSKGIRSRAGCWKSTHFFIAMILIVSLLIPAVYDLSQDSLSTLRKLFANIRSSLKDKKLEKFSEVEIYYGILAFDISVVFSLIIMTCCLMRNADYEYEYA